jgi:hypothetical protein
MLIKLGVHISSPENIKLQSSMKILNIYVTCKKKLVNSPSEGIFSHRKPHLRIHPSCDVNRIIMISVRRIFSIQRDTALAHDCASELVAGL